MGPVSLRPVFPVVPFCTVPIVRLPYLFVLVLFKILGLKVVAWVSLPLFAGFSLFFFEAVFFGGG